MRSLNTVLTFLVFTLTNSACTSQNTPGIDTAATNFPNDKTLSKERLLAEIPENWNRILTNKNSSLRLTEYVPPDSDESSWTEKLSLESFSQTSLPDPLELLDGMAITQQKACEKFTDTNTFSGYENSYPTAVRLFNCDKDKLTRMRKISLIKAIQGSENVYVISRSMRLGEQQSNLSEAQILQSIARWSRYLKAISVCELGNEQHPCPTP